MCQVDSTVFFGCSTLDCLASFFHAFVAAYYWKLPDITVFCLHQYWILFDITLHDLMLLGITLLLHITRYYSILIDITRYYLKFLQVLFDGIAVIHDIQTTKAPLLAD